MKKGTLAQIRYDSNNTDGADTYGKGDWPSGTVSTFRIDELRGTITFALPLLLCQDGYATRHCDSTVAPSLAQSVCDVSQ